MTEEKAIRLRPLTEADLAVIQSWPLYTGDMAQMDYALRQDGWLQEFWSKPQSFFYGAIGEGDQLIGFTLLAGTGHGEVEFRIGLRADWTGRGLGTEIALRTLRIGFGRFGFGRIHLIVRDNNFRGLKLYRRLGFMDLGACHREVLGMPVDFLENGD